MVTNDLVARDFWQDLEVLNKQHWLSESFAGSGEFTFSGTLRISGRWDGSIEGLAEDSQLHLLKTGILKGRLKAQRVIVEGRCECDFLICDFLQVTPGAFLSGNIRAVTLVIDPGAIVEAQFQSPIAD